MSDDHCIVCADPLLYTAYGQCGHKETCSTCVSRLRSVLKDQRCAYCQQTLDCVFVTRFAGDYTQQIAPEAFAQLKSRAKNGDLYFLNSAQAYFDDKSHFDEIRGLCSFTHPLGEPGKVYTSLRTLKEHLKTNHKRFLCDICLEGRKVFIAEQIAYTKSELDHHMRQGDVDGPMAESGFKGHPDCRFCKKRFYGENELYQHMHSTHEECFLCRRSHPHRHIYYRDYADMENHFRQEHYVCEHPECLEKKFIVFPTEQELKTHTAREHGQTLSKIERKQALTLPVAFNYRRGSETTAEDFPSTSAAASNLAAVAASGQRAVIIGGAASIPSQFTNRNARQNQHQVDIAAATAASLAQPNGSSSSRPTSAQSTDTVESSRQQMSGLSLRETDFPSMVAPSAAAAGPAVGGRWAGAAGATGAPLAAEDFTSLPGTSKSAKRRAAASKKNKSAAELLGGGGAVRIVNNRGVPLPDQFPTLGEASTSPMREVKREVEDLEAEFQPVQRKSRPAGIARPPSFQEMAEPSGTLSPGMAPTRANQVFQSSKNNKKKSAAAAAAAAAAAPPLPLSAQQQQQQAEGGISNALRTANKELIAKIKSRLGNNEKFNEFRQQSSQWLKNDITSKAYHSAIASLGLVSLVPELAATCPDAHKRDELLNVHSTAFVDRPVPESGAARGSWMPPEAAAAGAAHAAENSSWKCGVCTLVNIAAAVTCEACGHPKNYKQQQGGGKNSGAGGGGGWSSKVLGGGGGGVSSTTTTITTATSAVSNEEAFPSLPLAAPSTSYGAGPSSSSSGNTNNNNSKKGGKKGKQSLADFYQNTKVHPQNTWKNPNLKGQWASDTDKFGLGKLAAEERAMKDAWEKKK